MGLYSTKRLTQQVFRPVINRLIDAHVSPDWFTGGALILALLAALCLLSGTFLPVVFLLPLRLLFNVFDGEVARGTNTANRRGEVKNELGDALADALIFGALAFLTPLTLSIPALVLVLISEFVGVLAKAVGGQRQYGGWMGKPDRMFTVAAASLVMALTGWQTIFTLALALIVLLEIQTVVVRLGAIDERG